MKKDILLFTDKTLNPAKVSFYLNSLFHSGQEISLTILGSYCVSDSDPEKVIYENDKTKENLKTNLQKTKEFLDHSEKTYKLSTETMIKMGTPINILPDLLEEKSFDFLVLKKVDTAVVESVVDKIAGSKNHLPLILFSPKI